MLLDAMITAVRTPFGQLFDRGIYRYSRHPLYFSFIILLIGVSFATASWIFLLFSAVYGGLLARQSLVEEKDCLKIFGGEYQRYMDRTPRWLGLPNLKLIVY